MKCFKIRSLFFTGILFLSFLLPFNLAFAQIDIYSNDDDGSYHISEDTVWTKDPGPYLIHQDITIDDGSVLTIEPGTIVKIDPGIYFYVFGKLIVDGNVNEKVYFTSTHDKNIGADFLGSNDYLSPDISKWGGLQFIYGGNYEINNTEIEYAQQAISTYIGDGVITSAHIQNCDKGIFVYEGNLSIDDSVFEHISSNSIEAVLDSTVYVGSSTIKYSGNIISLFNNSSTTIRGSLFEDINGADAVEAYSNSSINIFDSDFKSITGLNTIEASGNVALDISGTTFKNIYADSAIAFYDCNNNPSKQSLSINNSSLDTGSGIGLYAFCNIKVYLENSKIKNFSGDGIQTFSGANISVVNSEISNNENGIESWGANVEIKNSSIANNTSFGIYNLSPYFDSYFNVEVQVPSIKAVGNWWGNISGPFNGILNATGTANQVSGNVEFSPWLVYNPNNKNPLIIIPGIMGTEIYKNYGDNSEIWPNMGKLISSFTDGFLNDLSFKKDGTENTDFPMKLGDIVRKVDLLGKNVSDTFDGLISTLTKDGYMEGINLFVFPYDWRESDSDTAILLKNKIDDVLLQTGANNVDIIAHSMGGLVAQKYIADNGGDKVDKLFFIGTPHLGAPKAFKALIYGDDMGINKLHYSILYPQELKLISQNFPSVFDLLPSRTYIDGNQNISPNKYVYDTTASTSRWLNYDETKDFMINHGVNSSLFSQAESFHESTDSFDLKGVEVYNFSGCGLTKTIGDITAKKKRSWTSLWLKVVDDYSIKYTNGDETVPLTSAVGPFDDHNYYVKNAVHSELPSTRGVPETIFSILSGDKMPTFSGVSTSSSFCDIRGIVLSTHSPVSVNIYDDIGNHTGPTDNGDIEYGLSGVSYDKILDDTFVFLPDDNQKYTVLIKPATSTVAYDLSLEKVGDNNLITKKAYWNKVSVKNTFSNSSIYLEPTDTNYVINTDEDNDGIFELTTSPSSVLSFSVAEDVIAPQTSSVVSKEGLISLSATDDNAGVLETQYSFDGNTWVSYSAPFLASENTLSYFSTDNAGNVEMPKTVIIPESTKKGPRRRKLSIVDFSTTSSSSNPLIISGGQRPAEENVVTFSDRTASQPVVLANDNYSSSILFPISSSSPITSIKVSDRTKIGSNYILVPKVNKSLKQYLTTTTSLFDTRMAASVASSGVNTESVVAAFILTIFGVLAFII